jgi:hypothetical protein
VISSEIAEHGYDHSSIDIAAEPPASHLLGDSNETAPPVSVIRAK